MSADQLLFSYGTLQLEPVQRANFGRILTGFDDALAGFALVEVEIADPQIAAISGSAVHLGLVAADAGEPIAGKAYWLTADELTAADVYEGDNYRRIAVRLASGAEAWVYIAALTPDCASPGTPPAP